MPISYQCNDNTLQISNRKFNRVEIGLPRNGFVFTCFNSNYKITPDEVDIWMRLLCRVKSSCLWLHRSSYLSETNLKREAEIRGVDPSRLIFSKAIPMADHLARLQCGDLFLDTFNYNA